MASFSQKRKSAFDIPAERTAGEEWAQQIDRLVDQNFARLVAIRRHLHAHPEPSGEERETTSYLEGVLAESSLPLRRGLDERGLILEGSSGPPSRRIALRADLDALKIHDTKNVPYRSCVDGVMHACGHDAHAATVLGALWALQGVQQTGSLPWPVCWRGIFQPAEETSAGALEMIAAGALEDVNAILSLHVDPSRDVGKIGVRAGIFTAACEELEVRIDGRGGHAARPHESLDPIAAAAQLVSSIYLFVPRAVDSQDPVVVTIGQIEGGDNPNVIPETVFLRGTIRTLGAEIRGRTNDHILQLARGLAEAAGVKINVRFHRTLGSVENDFALTDLIRRVGADVLGPEGVEEVLRPSMGGEDFANYLTQVPGCMFRLGCRSPAAGGAPLHSPEFDIDERAIAIGAKVLARAVVLWSDPERPGQRGLS